MILKNRRSKTLIVIPARLGSTRLARKVLAPLGGIPVVEHVRRAATRANCGPVVVATDSDEVAEAIERHGGAAVLTSRTCASGTDRVAQATRIVESANGRKFSTVVNVQGDEPFIRPSTIRKVAGLLTPKSPADIGTAVVPFTRRRLADDPSLVKAVVAKTGRCLYFSRQPVPHSEGRQGDFMQHIGIYGFKRRALDRFVRLKPSRLEKTERLEQLRALEDGMTIFAVRVRDVTVAIDTRADLRRASRFLKRGAHG